MIYQKQSDHSEVARKHFKNAEQKLLEVVGLAKDYRTDLKGWILTIWNKGDKEKTAIDLYYTCQWSVVGDAITFQYKGQRKQLTFMKDLLSKKIIFGGMENWVY
jgi:hypothetical protein